MAEENGMEALSESTKDIEKVVYDTSKIVSEKTKKVTKKVNEKSMDYNPKSKNKKRWMWIIGVLLGCYFISKIFGLDRSINDEDTLSLIGQNISDTNKLYGDGKLYEAIHTVKYRNGLAVNYYSIDNMEIVYVSIESPYSGTLCNLSIDDDVDTVTEEINKLDAKLVEEVAAEGYSVEDRGYRNYSFQYDGKIMICSVSFQGGVVSKVTCFEKNGIVDLY